MRLYIQTALLVCQSVFWLVACGTDRSASHVEPKTAGSLASPYAGMSSSVVRSLTTQEVDDLLAGRGLGMARAAELNGYPGPRHVLDLQSELGLSGETIAKAQQLFDEMQTEALPLGAQVVRLEKELGDLFAGHVVDDAALSQRVDALAALMGELRVIHLRAHIAMSAVLMPDQVQRYQQLRGYAAVDAGSQTGGTGGPASGVGGSMVDPHAHHHGQ